ncbi:MAG: aryl-sulfate sulfotransferase [Anaerolineae bacterium]|nr:aryl-sulfate sulfotransferase [Anaerolineae bacterium]
MASQSRKDSGVTIYQPDRCYAGYTLFCHTYEDPRTSQDGRAHMYLIDMHGQVVHEWTTDTAVQLLELLPDATLYYSTRDRSNIDRAGLYRLAPDSSLLWRYHCRIDHDFHVMDDGRLMIHTLIDKMVPRLGPELRRNPYIVEIGPDKELLWEWHGEEHIQELIDLCGLEVPIDWPERMRQEVAERRAWDERLQSLPNEELEALRERLIQQRRFDWAHNNTCEVIPDTPASARDSRFRAGNILFSYRSLDIIGVIDRVSGQIVWAWGPGELDGQHQPTMLSNGHILIYDNGSRRGWSRVIELDPITERIVWEYRGTPQRSFYSGFISGAQRLPNGNTFICEGGPGRLFEVTSGGEIVWEYRSPYGEEGTYGIYRATRYPPEFVEPLLRARET